MKKNCTVLVACHKKDKDIRQDDIYVPIHVGRSMNSNLNLGFIGDDTGDNISSKNRSYNELTALYWGWRNISDKDYLGLCHYRRYFANTAKILNYLDKYDVLAVKAVHMHSIAIELSFLITPEEVAIMIDTLLEIFPENRELIIKYFYRNNVAPQCNMFIMPKVILNEYCSQLFNILSIIEKRVKPFHYTRLQRDMGYIGEAIMGFLLLRNNYRVKYVKSEGHWKQNILKDTFRTIRNKIVFSLMIKPRTPLIFPAVITGLKNDGIELKNI